MNPTMIGVLAIVAIALVAMAMRRRPDDDAGSMPDERAGEQPEADDEPDDEDEDEDDAPDHIAVTSDGLAFVPRPHGVRIAPERSFRRPARAGDDERPTLDPPGSDDDARGAVLLSAGDLIAVRVRRGAPDLDPWRLEALGRDRDLSSWIFETHEAAEAAQNLVQRRVVRVPLDEDGEPTVIGDAEFEQAERELEQTLHELTTMTDDEAGEDHPR